MNARLVRTLAFVALMGIIFAASCATFVRAEGAPTAIAETTR
jgi:hypothetical protein